MKKVAGIVDLNIVTDDVEITRAESPAGKPFIKLLIPGVEPILLSTNICEMIGGAAAGARKRWEDQQHT